jgi:hypothetical protein
MNNDARLKVQQFLQLNHSQTFSTDFLHRYLSLPIQTVEEICDVLIVEGFARRPEFTDYVVGIEVDWKAVHEQKAARPAWSCTCDEDRYCPPCFDDVKALHGQQHTWHTRRVILWLRDGAVGLACLGLLIGFFVVNRRLKNWIVQERIAEDSYHRLSAVRRLSQCPSFGVVNLASIVPSNFVGVSSLAPQSESDKGIDYQGNQRPELHPKYPPVIAVASLVVGIVMMYWGLGWFHMRHIWPRGRFGEALAVIALACGSILLGYGAFVIMNWSLPT